MLYRIDDGCSTLSSSAFTFSTIDVECSLNSFPPIFSTQQMSSCLSCITVRYRTMLEPVLLTHCYASRCVESIVLQKSSKTNSTVEQPAEFPSSAAGILPFINKNTTLHDFTSFVAADFCGNTDRTTEIYYLLLSCSYRRLMMRMTLMPHDVHHASYLSSMT